MADRNLSLVLPGDELFVASRRVVRILCGLTTFQGGEGSNWRRLGMFQGYVNILGEMIGWLLGMILRDVWGV